MRIKEYCNKCGREYDGKYPCPDCGCKDFAEEKKDERGKKC